MWLIINDDCLDLQAEARLRIMVVLTVHFHSEMLNVNVAEMNNRMTIAGTDNKHEMQVVNNKSLSTKQSMQASNKTTECADSMMV